MEERKGGLTNCLSVIVPVPAGTMTFILLHTVARQISTVFPSRHIDPTASTMHRMWQKNMMSWSNSLLRLRTGAGDKRLLMTITRIAGCAFIAAGCASQAPAGQLPVKVPVRPITSMSMVRLPLDSYYLTFSQQMPVLKAYTRLVDSCVQTYGLAPQQGLAELPGFPLSAVDNSIVQYLSVASASQYGFNPPATGDLAVFERLNAADQHGPGPSRSMRQVMNGPRKGLAYNGRPIPLGGCTGEADSRLASHVSSSALVMNGLRNSRAALSRFAFDELTNGVLPGQLQSTAVSETKADPRILTVTRRWSKCMSAAGYSYASPADAMSDPRWYDATASAASIAQTMPLQIRVAAATARCEKKTDYAGTRLAVVAAYENRLINSHVTQLQAFKAGLRTIIVNATAVLEGRKSF